MNQRSNDRKPVTGIVRKLAPFAVAVLISIGAPTALAEGQDQAGPAPTTVGNPVAGREAAQRCAGCHGPEGLGVTPDIPHLAGQHAAYLLAALNAYRTGNRGGPDLEVMAEIVGGLKADEMADLAAYYGGLERFTLKVEANGEAARAAREVEAWDALAEGRAAAEACADCHGADGNSEIPGMPGLAGQPKAYLVSAMHAYKDGTRQHDDMQAFVELFEPADLERIARYYASLTPRRAETPGSGDPYAGLAPTAACAGCHGKDGNARDPKTPRLAGLDETYLVAAIQAYKAGTRNHDVMRDLVSPIDTTDILNVSAYYAASKPRAQNGGKPATVKEWTARCNRCHGNNGNSEDPRFPILAGQSKDYLVKALKLYHGGERASTMMQAMSFPMGETEIEKVAAFYAGQTAR